MNNQAQIEIHVVFGQYEQTLIDGFSIDLAALAEKWQLQTKSTSYSVIHTRKKKFKRLKSMDAHDLRRSARLAAKQNN
jgi:hypothetical protein